ncbi:hypothetical protein N431DRAFT_476858 [Stipitochalara longipes BDJ]|nr:hypothetical protein N431DRAFT_476858 [Stipitochalara longipes BDJ]
MPGTNGIHTNFNFPVPIQLHPEIAYRDYLRKIWTDGIQNQYPENPNAAGIVFTITEAQALSQLEDRILLSILKSPTAGGFGFGLPTTSIPLRGSVSAEYYVQKLLTATGQTAEEMSKRYRTQFVRSAIESSNPVWENVYTLQAFYRDSFQSEPDAAHALPDILGQPIIPSFLQGTAPFFLDFDEWVAQQQTVPLENYFLVRDIFKINVTAETRTIIQNQGAIPGYASAWLCTAYLDAFALYDRIVSGFGFLDQNNYTSALTVLNAAHGQALGMFWATNKYGGQSLMSRLPTQFATDIAAEFGKRASFSVTSFDQLLTLIQRWQISGSLTTDNPGTGNFDEANAWILEHSQSLLCSLAYVALFTLPVLVAQASIGVGDFSGAIRLLGRSSQYLVGFGSAADTSAWWIGGALNTTAVLYQNGSLPYTTTSKNMLEITQMDFRNDPFVPPSIAEGEFAKLEKEILASLVHPVEALYFRLQMGGAMLDWADSLFRTDDKSGIARARELYKGVYILWGKDPGINPDWAPVIIHPNPVPDTGNPAKLSQLARAEVGFTSIGAGLNFFGFSDDMVPMLRYSTLKLAADPVRVATIENLKNSAMLQRANLQMQIAQQQAGIAGDQIQQAQVQVTLVQNQITAQEGVIADHDSFWGQLGDYFNGLSSIVSKSGPLKGAAASTAATESNASTAALAGAGTGALVTAGIGAWFVASYLTLSSMATAQDGRQKQLANLETQNLPFAQAGVDVATRSQTIALLQSQVASVDAQLATQLISQADLRFLSIEFWNSMALLMERIFRQYLTLATRTAWLAERALAYDTGSDSRIIRQDYYSQQSLGAGGAEELQVDLATLDASRLSSIQETVPIKYTISLGRDFPLQFGQLLAQGSCTFFVQE